MFNLKKFLSCLGIVFMLAASGCNKVTTEAFICVDTSGSTDDQRKSYCGVMDGIVEALPRGTRVNLYGFNEKVYELDSKVPDSPEEFWEVQDSEFMVSECKGSRVDKMLSVLKERLEKITADQVVIIFLWDGENTGEDIRPLLKELSMDPRITALFIGGTDSDLRVIARNKFSCFHDRLILCGMHDMGDGIYELRKIIRRQVVANK